MFVDGKVTEFVDVEEFWAGVFLELLVECMGGLGFAKVVDHTEGGGEEGRLVGEAGLVGDGSGDVGLADAGGADEDDVGILLEEVETEEVLDLLAVDLFGPGP